MFAIVFTSGLGLMAVRAASSTGLRATRGRRAGNLALTLASTPLFFHALQKTDRRAGKLKMFAQTILKEALVAEMQALGLIGEKNESGR